MTAPMNSPAGREGTPPSVSANDEMAGRPGLVFDLTGVAL